MAFTEALRLVVDADTKGAIQGVEKLGATAERELSRSTGALDKWGNRLTSIGTGMVTFGAAAVVGLGAMAKQSEEAQLATLKLQNTLDNMPKLAGESADQFVDLAEGIQKVTAADADAIVEGEALLGTFNLTAQQIKGITPLVVDYARKFGIDIPDAAIQVGKALDGQVGALKRNGVSIDEVLFKTDRYKAVQEALSNQVGGFAEAEGKTFAGSLERMKNELGDLAEGVGGGAVDAFTTMFGAVEKVAGALESVSPGAQNTIGKIATFGAVGLIAAGGVSALIGQVIKAREMFGALADGVSAAAGSITKARIAVLGVVTAIAAAVVAAKEISDRTDGLKVDFEGLSDALFSTSDATRKGVTDFVALLDSMGKLQSTFEGVLEQTPEAASQFIRIAEAAGVSKDKINEMKAALEEKKSTDENATAAQSDYNEEVQAGADATDNATEAIKSYKDELTALFDPLFGAVHAQQQLFDANAAVTGAEMELAKAIHDHGTNSLEAMAATDKLRQAQIDAAEAAVGQEAAMSELKDAVANGTVSVDAAKAKLQEWVVQGGITQTTADQTAAAFDNIAGKADELDGRNVNMTINVVTRQSTIVAGSRNIPLRAHGGPTSAGQIYQVAEQGPELFQDGDKTYLLAGNSGYVYPMRPMPNGGSAGGPIDVHSHVYLDGREITHTVKRVVRNDHGGNVQAALGWSAA